VSEPGTRKSSVPLRYIGRLSELAGYTSAVLILASVLVICYGVLLRYFAGASTVWQTELSVYFLIYAAFVGSAYGLKHDDHVKIEFVVRRLPPRAREGVRFLTALLGFGLAVVVAALAFDLWWDATQAGQRSGTAWNPPLTYPYLILPLGMVVLALQYLALAVEIVQGIRSGGDP
jgi:TRAP-type C4-dicarboxylate transport system permease small subunit